MTLLMYNNYKFAFSFTNPDFGQDARNVSISGSGTATFVPELMHNSQLVNGNAAPLLIADFTQRFISQSTPNQAQLNTISITIATRASLLALDHSRPVVSERAASVVVISGLLGSRTASATIPITGSGTAVFGSTAVWSGDDLGGKLSLTVLADTVAKVPYIVQMNLTNPSAAAGQESPPIEIHATGITIANVNMTKALDNKAPLLIAGFVTTSIAHHTPAQGAMNLLTITLSTRCILPMNTRVTISGLTGAGPSSSTVNITHLSSGAHVFGRVAHWDFEAGSLVFTTAADTAAHARYVMGVTIRNGDAPQFAPRLQIATGPGLIILENERTLERAAGNSAPLLIAGFTTAFVRQTNASASAYNELHIKIASYSDLPVINPALLPSEIVTQITISGLAGIRSASSSQLPVLETFGDNAQQVNSTQKANNTFFSSDAVWNTTQGTLILTIISRLDANTTYELIVPVLNSFTGQLSPTIRISCHEIGIYPVSVSKGPGNTAPLLIGGFVHKGIGQSSGHRGRLNEISVTISTTVSLQAGSSVTLSISALAAFASYRPDLRHLSPWNVFASNASFTAASASATSTPMSPGTLKLTIAAASSPLTLYVFRINVTNSPTFQPSDHIQISSSNPYIPLENLKRATGAGAPLSVTVPPATKSNCSNLSSWTQLTSKAAFSARRGMAHVSRGALKLVDPSELQDARKVFGEEATWRQNGTVILEVQGEKTMRRNTTYTLTLSVINPEAPPPLTDLRISAFGSAVIEGQFLHLNASAHTPEDASSALPQAAVAALSSARIAQTMPYPLANNTITVTLTSAVNLTGDAGCIVTVTGLTGSETPDNSRHGIRVLGSSSADTVWGVTGEWRRKRGSLVLPISPGQTMVAGKQYVVSFDLVNSPIAQEAPHVSMLASGEPFLEAVALPHDLVTVLPLAGARAGDAAALKIDAVGFKVKTLAQSSPLPGDLNTIIISLSVTARVVHNGSATVAITGLLGSRTHKPDLDVLAHPNASFGARQPFASPALWQHSAGHLVLALTEDLVPGQLYAARVRLYNPYEAQDSPQNMKMSYSSSTFPYYGSDHNATVARFFPLRVIEDAHVPQGDAAVLKVDGPSFVMRHASQTSNAPGARNNITLVLQTNFDLSHLHASRLTLAGLGAGDTHTHTHTTYTGRGNGWDGRGVARAQQQREDVRLRDYAREPALERRRAHMRWRTLLFSYTFTHTRARVRLYTPLTSFSNPPQRANPVPET